MMEFYPLLLLVKFFGWLNMSTELTVKKFLTRGTFRSPHLRSLVYLSRNEDCITNNRSWKLLKPMFKGLKLLRVLDLEGADIKGGKLPKDVGKLIHLRFLSLQLSNVSRFPSSSRNLRLFDILDLRVSSAMHMYPM